MNQTKLKLILLTAVCLSGCGQKGALFLPEDAVVVTSGQSGTVESSQTDSPSTDETLNTGDDSATVSPPVTDTLE